MFANMENWSGLDEYSQTETSVYRVAGSVAGYFKSVKNLRLISMKIAGHMVPRSQPEYAFDMFNQVIQGTLW